MLHSIVGNPTILCGCIRLSRTAFEQAQDAELLRLACMASNDPDDFSVVMKGVRAKDLFKDGEDHDEHDLSAINTYDARERRWVFAVSLHGDDLPNADTDDFAQTLSTLKDEPGTDFVFAYEAHTGTLWRSWRVARGDGSELEELPELSQEVRSLFAHNKIAEASKEASVLLLGGA